jgi:hypothetical protein
MSEKPPSVSLLPAAGLGVAFIVFSVWRLWLNFPITDLAAPFRQRSDNFLLFATFCVLTGFYLLGLGLGVHILIRVFWISINRARFRGEK